MAAEAFLGGGGQAFEAAADGCAAFVQQAGQVVDLIPAVVFYFSGARGDGYPDGVFCVQIAERGEQTLYEKVAEAQGFAEFVGCQHVAELAAVGKEGANPEERGVGGAAGETGEVFGDEGPGAAPTAARGRQGCCGEGSAGEGSAGGAQAVVGGAGVGEVCAA